MSVSCVATSIPFNTKEPKTIPYEDNSAYPGVSKQIFIGADSQSSLTSLNPLKRPKFGHVDSSKILAKICSAAKEFNQLVHLQWVPSHTGINANEEVDAAANTCRRTFDLDAQQRCNIHPATLKTSLRKNETQHHHRSLICDMQHTGI